MSKITKFISNNVFHILKIFELMKQPNGTSTEELSKELQINRRSVFRLLKIIEQKFSMPFIVSRASFGGAASYHLSPAFIEKLSGICLPELRLTFYQAIFVHLVLNDVPVPSNSTILSEIDQLRKHLQTINEK
jgi:hypothetical protein